MKIVKRMAALQGKMTKDVTVAARRWRKLRGVVNAVAVFKAVSRDHKMFGAAAQDDHINWVDLEKVDYSSKVFFVMMPDSKFRQNWDLLTLVTLVTIAFYVPFSVSFWSHRSFSWDHLDGWDLYDLLTTAFFAVDVALNFVTGYQLNTPDRKVEIRLNKIFSNYMKGFFILDFMATFPFYILLAEGTALSRTIKLSRLPRLLKILRIMRLFRLLRVYKLQVYIMKIEATYKIQQGVMRLVNIVFTVVAFTHWMACLWFGIATIAHPCDYDGEVDDPSLSCSWIDRHYYRHKAARDQYVAALYWSVTTLTTVRNRHPRTD